MPWGPTIIFSEKNRNVQITVHLDINAEKHKAEEIMNGVTIFRWKMQSTNIYILSFYFEQQVTCIAG